MQNQKTEPKPAEDLELLNAEEEKLVEAKASGADNVTAYTIAYGASNYSPPALRVKACRKLAEPHIQAHLRAIQSVGLANVRLTLEQRLEAELGFAQRAEDAGNFGAAGGTHDRINKLCGHYVERFEDITPRDPSAALEEIARLSPEVARQLAALHGVQLIEAKANEPA